MGDLRKGSMRRARGRRLDDGGRLYGRRDDTRQDRGEAFIDAARCEPGRDLRGAPAAVSERFQASNSAEGSSKVPLPHAEGPIRDIATPVPTSPRNSRREKPSLSL